MIFSRYLQASTTHKNRIDNIDAISWLKGLPDKAVDCFVTDIAYQSLEKHRKIGTTTRLTGAWFDIFPNENIPELLAEMYRTLKNNRHAYMYCDDETSDIIKPMAKSAGFTVWKRIVWDKVNMGMGYHYRGRYEFILFLEKGKRRLNDMSVTDVITVKKIHRGYPTEKPVEVSEVLIMNSTHEGEIIADPFMGSGSVAVAAVRNNRVFYGTDISRIAVETTKRRILS